MALRKHQRGRVKRSINLCDPPLFRCSTRNSTLAARERFVTSCLFVAQGVPVALRLITRYVLLLRCGAAAKQFQRLFRGGLLRNFF
jgi:hypothetical protein